MGHCMQNVLRRLALFVEIKVYLYYSRDCIATGPHLGIRKILNSSMYLDPGWPVADSYVPNQACNWDEQCDVSWLLPPFSLRLSLYGAPSLFFRFVLKTNLSYLLIQIIIDNKQLFLLIYFLTTKCNFDVCRWMEDNEPVPHIISQHPKPHLQVLERSKWSLLVFI